MIVGCIFLFFAVVVTSSTADEGYIGCYKDDANRKFKYKVERMGSLTSLARCRGHCAGYTYVGLQASDWCTCSDTLYNNDIYPKVSDSECNRPCLGETSRMCGGSWRNSVYKVSVQCPCGED